MIVSDGIAEREILRDAFAEVFPEREVKLFGHLPRRVVGVYDGNEGVQWNTGAELVAGQWKDYWMAVNLEGVTYDERRPILNLIKRELESPLLFGVRDRIRQPEKIDVTLTRDAWHWQNRPIYFTERVVLPRTSLDKLSVEAWHDSLVQASDCFDTHGQTVHRQLTFYNKLTGQRERAPRSQLYEMTPHLGFRCALWLAMPTSQDDRIVAMRRVRQRLQPLYEFVRDRSV